MVSLLPNYDDLVRWPALDQHGQMLAEPEQRRRRPAGQSMTACQTPAMPGIGPDDADNPTEPPHQQPLPHDDAEPPREWELPITQSAFVETLGYLGGRPPEAAGILLGPRDDEPLVTRFIPDLIGRGSTIDFELHAPFLNFLLQEFKAQGLTCKGIVHSHPGHLSHPSSGDLLYFQRLFARPANAASTHLFVPIVCDRRLFPYVYVQGEVLPARLLVV